MSAHDHTPDDTSTDATRPVLRGGPRAILLAFGLLGVLLGIAGIIAGVMGNTIYYLPALVIAVWAVVTIRAVLANRRDARWLLVFGAAGLYLLSLPFWSAVIPFWPEDLIPQPYAILVRLMSILALLIIVTYWQRFGDVEPDT